MGRARVLIAAGCAVALVLAGAVLGVLVDRQHRDVDGCGTGPVPSVEDLRAGPGDVLLTEQPLSGAVSVHIGQRLVVVLAYPGFGGWRAVSVDGTAARLVATVGAYEYRCQRQPPAAMLAIVRAETSGTATLSSGTDVVCRHARLPCGVPGLDWRRTVTVLAG